MPRTVYVVTSGLPGPGAFQLLIDAGITEPGDKRTRQVLAGACEFVELEDERGYGLGSSIGVAWLPHPTVAGLHRLGPLAPAGVPADAVALEEIDVLRRAIGEGSVADRSDALELLDRIEQRKGGVDARA